MTRRSGGVVCRHVDDLDAVFKSDTCDDLGQLICAFQPSPQRVSTYTRGANQKKLAHEAGSRIAEALSANRFVPPQSGVKPVRDKATKNRKEIKR